MTELMSYSEWLEKAAQVFLVRRRYLLELVAAERNVTVEDLEERVQEIQGGNDD